MYRYTTPTLPLTINDVDFFEMTLYHPVYYHNGTGIRLWTGGA